MFAVIQEVKTKKPSKGNAKSLETYESSFTAGGMEYCYYRYRKSDDCFERPIRKAASGKTGRSVRNRFRSVQFAMMMS